MSVSTCLDIAVLNFHDDTTSQRYDVTRLEHYIFLWYTMIKFAIHRSFFPKRSGRIHRCPTDTNKTTINFMILMLIICTLRKQKYCSLKFTLLIYTIAGITHICCVCSTGSPSCDGAVRIKFFCLMKAESIILSLKTIEMAVPLNCAQNYPRWQRSCNVHSFPPK